VVPEGYTELQRKLIHSRARATLRRLEGLSFKKPSPEPPLKYTEAEVRAIHQRAHEKLFTPASPSIHPKALAYLGFIPPPPPKKPTLAERRAIHAKALAIVNRHKLDKLIAKLKTRTVERGCTPQEAEAARTAVDRLLKNPLRRAQQYNDKSPLSAAELRRFRAWYDREQ